MGVVAPGFTLDNFLAAIPFAIWFFLAMRSR